MCGIAGYLSRHAIPQAQGEQVIAYMNQKQLHRGPDGEGHWVSSLRGQRGNVGLGHQRLSIIDLASGQQPMTSERNGNTISYNGEIYNYIELREVLSQDRPFQTTSDTEVILRAYERWGAECVNHLRGMFAFALWDENRQQLFVARDRFGIKPFYYAIEEGVFYFASEIKTLHPFLSRIQTHLPGLRDYFSFQFCLGEKTLFEGIKRLQPAYCGYVDPEKLQDPQQCFHPWKYWEVHYNLDWNHTEQYFVREVKDRMMDSMNIHLRSDVPVGAYVSGGMDSSIVASAARDLTGQESFYAFNGKFASYEGFDESQYARSLADERQLTLIETDIHDTDFVDCLPKVIYHLDRQLLLSEGKEIKKIFR